MTKRMGWKKLESAEKHWETDLGAWFSGERVVFRGKDLLTDLTPLPWMELLLFGITGRRFSAEQVTLFEQMWTISVSYPDPRIWNNRVAALGGSARTTASLAVGAATAVTEAKIYGGQANFGAITFIRGARAAYEKGEEMLSEFVTEEIQRMRHIPGYGRPIVAQDERIPPLLKLADSLELSNGKHTKTALAVENILQAQRKRMRMNITGLAAALAADQGLTPREYQAYVCLAFGAGILPCYVDAANHDEGAFFPIRCDRIAYQGQSPRSWE